MIQTEGSYSLSEVSRACLRTFPNMGHNEHSTTSSSQKFVRDTKPRVKFRSRSRGAYLSESQDYIQELADETGADPAEIEALATEMSSEVVTDEAFSKNFEQHMSEEVEALLTSPG